VNVTATVNVSAVSKNKKRSCCWDG